MRRLPWRVTVFPSDLSAPRIRPSSWFAKLLGRPCRHVRGRRYQLVPLELHSPLPRGSELVSQEGQYHCRSTKDCGRKVKLRDSSFQQQRRELARADTRTEPGKAIRLGRELLPDRSPHRHKPTNRGRGVCRPSAGADEPALELTLERQDRGGRLGSWFDSSRPRLPRSPRHAAGILSGHGRVRLGPETAYRLLISESKLRRLNRLQSATKPSPNRPPKGSEDCVLF
jgi:hypothetical protein